MRETVSSYEKGLMGEDLACEYLVKKGMVLLQKRYRSLYGEIDLVMQEEEVLVFVEVKIRKNNRYGSGLEAIHKQKQKRLIQTASLYLSEKGTETPVRFDAVEITPGGITHIRGAFDASDMD